MNEPSIHIRRCLEYYLQRHFRHGRPLRTGSFGACAFADTFRAGSAFDDLSGNLEGGAGAGASGGLYDIIYLGGGHDFLDLTAALRRVEALLAAGGILVLPRLDVPTTHFCFDYLNQGDDFILHFTMEETAFLAFAPGEAQGLRDWTRSNFNRQQFPAFDPLRYTIAPSLPVRLSYEGYSATCGEELERGFVARSGRILSDGYRSRIRLKVAPDPDTDVAVAVEVRAIASKTPGDVTVTLTFANTPADVQVLTGNRPVTLRCNGPVAADGTVQIDLSYDRVLTADEAVAAEIDLPAYGLLAIELVSVAVTHVDDLAEPRSIRHHDGQVTTFSHAGQPFQFFIDNPHDSIQAHHRVGEFYEIEELQLIARHVKPGARILDVGANIGNHTVYFEKVLQAQRVVPIELQPRVIALLRLNAALNGLTRTDLSRLGMGFGAGDHEASIFIPQMFNVAGAQFEPAERGGFSIRRGDDVVAGEDFDLVKIDVEGMECDVIDGLDATIRRCRPKLFVEVWNNNLPRFHAQMDRLGYRQIEEWRRYDVAVNLLMGPADDR